MLLEILLYDNNESSYGQIIKVDKHKQKFPFISSLTFVYSYLHLLSYICSNWDSLCIEHALQGTCLDWCSSDRTQYIDALSITAIWGSFLYYILTSSPWLPAWYHAMVLYDTQKLLYPA